MTIRVSILPALILCAAVAGCKRAPAGEGTTGAGPAAPAAQGTPAPETPPPPKPMPAQLPDVLARVNGQPVTKFDFERLVKNMEAGNGPIPPERRDEVLRAALDQLITYHVLRQEAAARGLSIGDDEVNAQVQQMQGQFQDKAAFDKALASRNTSLDQFKADTRVDLLINKMMEAELATTNATDEEVNDFYAKNPEKFDSLRASHILVTVPQGADEATRKAARAKIDKVLARARAGEDFAKLAKENSDDGSREQGGDLGFFQRGRMVPEFEKAAFALKPGEISDVVTTQFGFHVIKATERRTVPLDEVKPQIAQFLTGQKRQQRGQAFVEAAKKKAKIEVLV